MMRDYMTSLALLGGLGMVMGAPVQAKTVAVASPEPIRLSSAIFTPSGGSALIVCDQVCASNSQMRMGQQNQLARIADVPKGQGQVTIFKRDSLAFAKFCDASGKLITSVQNPYKFSVGDQTFGLEGIGAISCSMDSVTISYMAINEKGLPGTKTNTSK